MLKVRVQNVGDEAPTTYTGPAYRRLLLASLVRMKGKGEATPLTETEVRAKPLTDLVAADLAWSAENNPGYTCEVVDE